MFRSKEEKADIKVEKQARRDEYLKKVLGGQISLIFDNPKKQKDKFLHEMERLAGLVADVSVSAAVTGDCNTLLDDVNTSINTGTMDKCAITGKFDKVKQRLIRAYDSRAARPDWASLLYIINFAYLAGFVFLIAFFKLIPGQPNLQNTACVCLTCALWGGLGGLMDASFALRTHFANQDFDSQYMSWYYLHPLLSLSRAAVIYLIFQAGLLAISDTTLKETAETSIGTTALPIALGFLAGFKQNTGVAFLNRVINSVFQSDSGDASK
jgi:hypothetical protein